MWPSEAAHVISYRSSIETKSISRFVSEILGFENFYVMTSLLTSRGLDRKSVWIVWAHYAVDDCVKIWSDSDKKWGRRSIFKIVTSRLWRHRVTWRHRWPHQWIAPAQGSLKAERSQTNAKNTGNVNHYVLSQEGSKSHPYTSNNGTTALGLRLYQKPMDHVDQSRQMEICCKSDIAHSQACHTHCKKYSSIQWCC